MENESRILMQLIIDEFPFEHRQIIDKFKKIYSVYDEMPYTYIEYFSELTTDAIKNQKYELASKYLLFISQQLLNANEELIKLIDVAYVESLMWNIEDNAIRLEGWKIIPANLKKLYEDLWGGLRLID